MMVQDTTSERATSAPVTLTIDGKKIATVQGRTVLEAATANGIYIPTLCYLKELSPIGSCRVCVVEVAGADRPQAACQLPVVEGMQVTTRSERLNAERKAMVQLLLVNHPLDCPVCERSGECRLQNLTYELGITQQIFKAEPVARQRADWGAVRYNPNLCVLCERCVHVCNEVQGVAAYKIRDNGYRSVIDTHDGKPLNCDFCGRCISVCPVGALNSGLKLQARSWEFEKVASVCPYCGTGCAITLDVKKDQIYRVSANPGQGINQGNLCAKGRFGFQFVDSDQRLKAPLVRKNGQLVESSWDEALALVADKLGRIKKEQGGQAIGGIGSERLPNEDNFLFQKFFKKVLGSNLVDHPRRMQSPAVSAIEGNQSGSSEDLLKADLILTVGAEPAEENPVIGNLIRRAMKDNNATLITLFDRQVRFKPHPHVKLTHACGQEAALLQAMAKADSITPLAEVAKTASIAPEALALAAAKLKQAKNIVILCGRQGAARALSEVLALAATRKAKILFYSEYCNTRGVYDMGLRPEPGTELLALAEAGKLKALYIMGEDPVTRLRGVAVQKALKKVDFLVVQDMFLTPTAALAQVVLPTVSFAEREGTFTNLEGRVQKLQRAITPRGQAKPDWQILALLENRLAGQFNYDSAEDIFKEIAATVPAYRGMTYAQLGAQGSLCQHAKATVKPAPAVGAGADEEDKERPFVLLEGNSFFHLGPYSLRAEALLAIEPQCSAQISPKDAADLKIQDGDRIAVASAEGTLTVAAKITEKINPGTVFIPDGFETSPVNALRTAQPGMTRVKITRADKK
jgi:NADH-quinone oxidoreductase chain G